MKTFTIENETNNIMAHATAKEAEALENAVSFRNEAGLAKLAADWPTARLIEIWNSLPGVTPVRKFTNRDTAIRRIWAQIQNLGDPAPTAAVAEPTPATPEVAPTETDVVPDAAPTTRRCAEESSGKEGANRRRNAQGGERIRPAARGQQDRDRARAPAPGGRSNSGGTDEHHWVASPQRARLSFRHGPQKARVGIVFR
jgi:hypothetical protein